MATLISDSQYQAALERGRQELAAPHAIDARFDRVGRKLTIVFSNGLEVSLRPEVSEFLREHADADLSNPYVTPGGDGLIFEAADIAVSIPGLISQLLPENIARKKMASALGSRTSERKSEAARANGAKGGRPKRSDVGSVTARTARPDAISPTGLWTYEQIATQVVRAKEHLAERGIKLHPSSTLAAIFRQGLELSTDWEAGIREEPAAARIVEAAHAMRISQAVLTLDVADAAKELLNRVSKKSMDLSSRDPSQGKDALWEIELLARLRARGVRAWLAEPDIVAEFGGVPYPIACKKIYSAARFADAVRSGVGQLAQFGGIGLVAINIDDLIPSTVTIHAATTAMELSNRLNTFLRSILDAESSLTRRLVAEHRCDGFLLSATVLSQIKAGRAGLNIQTEDALFDLGADDRQHQRVMTFATSFPRDSSVSF